MQSDAPCLNLIHVAYNFIGFVLNCRDLFAQDEAQKTVSAIRKDLLDIMQFLKTKETDISIPNWWRPNKS